MFVERSLDRVNVDGDRELLERLLDAAAPTAEAPLTV
jgi:hypothetical protein